MNYVIVTILAAFFIFSGTDSNAVQVSRPSPTDSRLRFITYHPNDIHKYVGYYDYQASILFGEGEEVKTISLGNAKAWQIVPAGSRLFIKPVEEDATTNMLLITNKRIYHFILEASEAGPDGINDENLVFETKFVYPNTSNDIINLAANKNLGPDMDEPEKYNFNYTISGSQSIAPTRIFDDGEFTYFQFSREYDELPAFFLVDSEGRDSLVNYRVSGNFIVVERVGSQFTLRHGADVTCVFNEMRPLRLISKTPTS